MSLDLWNFDKDILKRSISDMPNAVLKEQGDLLTEKTDGNIYGRVMNINIKNSAVEEIGYSIATKFELVVPALDNYVYTILIMYSNPEKNYQGAITIGSNIEDDTDSFNPRYVCEDKKKFIDALKEILSSSDVTEIIKTLYAKSMF